MTPSLAIRFAMLVGVLLFGGVTFFARKSGTAPVIAATDATMLLSMARVLWGVAIAGCVLLFFAARRNLSPARIGSLSIGAWALGEMVALFGGVVWYLTGTPAWYVPGVVFLVLTFLAFPGRRS